MFFPKELLCIWLRKSFAALYSRPGGVGVLQQKIGKGCGARFSKPLPYL